MGNWHYAGVINTDGYHI